MDGREYLVVVHAAGADLAGLVGPGDDALGQGVGAPAAGNPDLEVHQLGQGKPLFLQDLGNRLGEGVEAAVTIGGGDMDLAPQPHANTGGGG